MNDMLCVQINCFFVSHWSDVSRDIRGFLLHVACISFIGYIGLSWFFQSVHYVQTDITRHLTDFSTRLYIQGTL